jgi:MFS family permease
VLLFPLERIMPSTDARTAPHTARERRWGLAAAITSVTVFGLSIGQGAPLLSLLLEQRGTDPTLNGLNAGVTFIGVLLGPLLAPHWVRMKQFDGFAAWLVLRMALGVTGSSIFTSSEAWINLLAGDVGRGRIIGIYAAALSAGFGIGPLLLSITGIQGWAPFIGNAILTSLAMLPLLGVGDATLSLARERGISPLRMFARAPSILWVVVVFGLYESALMTLLPIWGVRIGLGDRLAAATLSAVYLGAILLQMLIGWLSDLWSRTAALGLCGGVGLIGALALAVITPSTPLLFCLLFVWGGVASGIYPVALSMAGDRFQGTDLVAINAAIIMAYGLGALAGPALGGVAIDISDPQGLLWLFVLMFAGLLAVTRLTAGQPPRRGTA